MSQDYSDGYAVTVTQRNGAWIVREYDDPFETLDTAIAAVRAMRSEGPAFALLNVEDEYFVAVRPGPARHRLVLSDVPVAVDDDYAAEVLDAAGVEIPEIDPADLDDTDGWADGDFTIFEDLGLSEQVLGILLDNDDDPDALIGAIADELGFADELNAALE